MEALTAALNRIGRRVFNMFGRGLVRRIEDDGLFQIMQLEMQVDELKDQIRRIQTYGLTAVPPLNAEALAVFPNGDRSTGVVIAVDDGSSRPKLLKAKEVCLYAAFGQVLHFREDGGITMHAAKGDDGYGDIDIRGGHVRIYGEKSVTLDRAGYGSVLLPEGETVNWVAGASGSSSTVPYSTTPGDEPEIGAPLPPKPDVPKP